ncbi:MAG: 3-deoxy-manno-octulosonate cytidylyltransferase [Bacteroidales bacterium]|jgi:3-deoxy-manno-octulosonate cytidylyltransferase (CMP-KDO synthetase)|nr:3-deoxy-manno-octulosonate cytidylyltransferase [Bacteroidales bacterium]
MKTLAVIPARYGSSRFVGKPLAKIADKEMIFWVCEAVNNSALFTKTIVATDNRQIYDLVLGHGFEAMMTSEAHTNGTQRCEQVLNEEEKAGNYYDVLVNVQGDEPMIKKEQLKLVLQAFEEDKNTQIATLCKRIDDIDTLLSPNVVKVAASGENALCFSRSVIPFARTKTQEEGIESGIYYKHIGLYAYKTEILHKLVALKPTPLEQMESLEQLRWLENGYRIKIKQTTIDSFGIDTKEELDLLNSTLLSNY